MKVSKVTSILLVVICSLTLLNFLIKYYSYLSLVLSSPNNTTPEIAQEKGDGDVPHPHDLYVPLLAFIPTKLPIWNRPWVLFTSSSIEDHFLGAAASFAIVFYVGKYLEGIWGSRELLKFAVATTLMSNLGLILYYSVKCWIWGDAAGSPPVMTSAAAFDVGLLVAVKQRIPNYYLLLFRSSLRIKVTYLPVLVLATIWVLLCLSSAFHTAFVMGVLGFISSWIYLRLYKSGANESQSYLLPLSTTSKLKQGNDHSSIASAASSLKSITSIVPVAIPLNGTTAHGDRSDAFAFATFFPFPVSLVVSLISTRIFNLLVRFNVLDEDDFHGFGNPGDDSMLVMDNVGSIRSGLVELSSLNGAKNVLLFSSTSASIKSFFKWAAHKNERFQGTGINNTMDKRRKLALDEME